MAGAPRDNDHSDYVHGTMDIREQASTFELVMNIVKWGSLVSAVVVLMLVMWFQPGGSFISAAIAGLVVAVAGWFMLRKKPTSH